MDGDPALFIWAELILINYPQDGVQVTKNLEFGTLLFYNEYSRFHVNWTKTKLIYT